MFVLQITNQSEAGSGMKIKSKQFGLALLAGVGVGLLVAILSGGGAWGSILSVVVATYLARVGSAKEGAVVGAIASLPPGLYLLVVLMVRSLPGEPQDPLTLVYSFALSAAFIAALGAGLGLLIGRFAPKNPDKEQAS